MNCPHCDGLTRVVKTKARGKGFTVRRRQCLKCHRRFTTAEQVPALAVLASEHGDEAKRATLC